MTYTIVTERHKLTGVWKWALYEGDHPWPESLIETGSACETRWGARRAAKRAARRRSLSEDVWGRTAAVTYVTRDDR